MKITARWIVVAAVATLSVGIAAAQCNEPMDGVVRNLTTEGEALGNVWSCPTSGNSGSPFCGVTYRFYTTDSGGTGAVNSGADGNPIYGTGSNGNYRTDVDNSANYFDGPHPCGVPMYIVWDGELDAETGDHRAYYGVQGQVIETGEFGNIFTQCGGTTRAISCFASIGGAETADIANTPQGTLLHTGGLAPIPVPLVESYDRVSGDIVLTWTAPGNFHTGGEGEANPIVGIQLYVLEDVGLLDSRSVTATDLAAGARLVREVALPATSVVLNDGVASDVTPGTGSLIPALKVVYAPSAGTLPMESLHFSANGSVVLIDSALYAEVTDFQGKTLGKSRGYTSVEVSWLTSLEENLDGFVLKRGTSLDGPFVAVTDLIPPRGKGGEGASYSAVDTFRARGAKELFYLLEIRDSDDSVRPHGPIRVVIETRPGVEAPE